MTDIAYNQKMAFNFLDELKTKFFQKYHKDEIKNAKSLSLNGFNGIYTSLVVSPSGCRLSITKIKRTKEFS